MAEENENNNEAPEEVSTEHTAQSNTPAESGTSGTEIPGGQQKSEEGSPEEGKGDEGTGQPEEATTENGESQEKKEGDGTGQEKTGEGTDEPEEHTESKGDGQGEGTQTEGKPKGSGSGEGDQQGGGDNKEEGDSGEGEGQKDPNKFDSIAVKIAKNIFKSFAVKDKFPDHGSDFDMDHFIFIHFPLAIYKSFAYIWTKAGGTRERLEEANINFDELVVLDRQLAKFMLKQTQINPRYYDVENAFTNIFFDVLDDIGAFQLENTCIRNSDQELISMYKTPTKLFISWISSDIILAMDFNKKEVANFKLIRDYDDNNKYNNYELLFHIKSRTQTAESRKFNLSHPNENIEFVTIYKKQLKALSDAV